MNGPLGGELTFESGVTREALPAALSAALAAAQTHAWPRAAEADVVQYTFDAGVTYEGDLTALRPWSDAGLTRPAALAALGRVGRIASRLHARGLVHGDLRAEHVWLGADGSPTLLTPARASAPGAALGARLHHGGALPSAVAFAAPEAVAGVEATPATDVYALAALTFELLSGYAPLGQVSLRPYAQGPMGALAACVEAALRQAPAARPSMDALADALDAASRARDLDAPQTGAYRASSPGAWAGPAPAAREGAAAMSPVLALVLVLGGLCAFVGAVLLVVAGWDVVGEGGRVAILAGLAGLSWGASALAARYRLDTGVTVGRGLACVFATVAVSYAFSLLHDPGRLALLVALTALAFVGGSVAERRGAPLGGAVLLALGTQLLWTVGAQYIHMSDLRATSGVVAALAAVVSATTYGLALWRRSGPFGLLAALDLAVLAVTLGDHLRSGSVMGPSAYALAVAGAYALLAVAATRREAPAAAQPLGLGAVAGAGISVIGGLVVLTDHWETHGLVAAAWPLAVAVAAATLVRARSPVGAMASFTLGAVVVLAPTAEALLRDELGFLLGAVAVGAAVLVAASAWAPLRERDDARTEALLAGLLGVMAAPTVRVLQAIDASHDAPWPAAGGAAWVTMAAAAAGLLALSYAVTSRVGRARRRLLEGAALSQFYGLLTLQVLATHDDARPAALALASSAALLTLGATTRRAAVLLLSAGALIVHLWIQYFVRLVGVFPLSVRLVGFGVGLLVGGVLYEQQVRHRLARLRDWN